MDLGLFLAVLWRSRRLVLGGVVAAVLLAVLAYGTPSFAGGHPTLKPRGAEKWQGESQLLISQASFPYRQSSEAAEPARQMGSLSPVYANLANGNVVQAEIRRQLGKVGTVKANEDVDLAASSFLPFVNFLATAPTRSEAAKLAVGAASIFQAFVAKQQVSAGVPAAHRIELTLVQSGNNPKLIEGHKVSIPILVFLAILIATVSIVFLRENVRPRVAEALERLPAPQAPLPLPEPAVAAVEEAPRHEDRPRPQPQPQPQAAVAHDRDSIANVW
jgi:hypothetical protein